MSLIIHMKIPGAIVIASDCRVTGNQRVKHETFHYVITDSEQKTFPIGNRIALSYSGDAELNGLPASFILRKAVSSIQASTTQEAAAAVLAWFAEHNIKVRPNFLISGYNGSVPSVLDLPSGRKTWTEQYPEDSKYGITTAGDSKVAHALIDSGTFDYHLIRAKDAVDLEKTLIQTTAKIQALQKGNQTVSDACDILVITETGMEWAFRSSTAFLV